MEIWNRSDANWHRLVDYFILFITVYGVWALTSPEKYKPVIVAIVALFVVVAIAQRLSIIARNNEIRCARTRDNALCLMHLLLQHAGRYALLAMYATDDAFHLHRLRRNAVAQFLDAANAWNLDANETHRVLVMGSDTDIRVLQDVMDEREQSGVWKDGKPAWAAVIAEELRRGTCRFWGDVAYGDYVRSLTRPDETDAPTDPGEKLS